MVENGVLLRLSPRQKRVALLVAQGRTNRQIAEELGISGFTARNEVVSILRRLEFKTRSQIAFLVGRSNLLPELDDVVL